MLNRFSATPQPRRGTLDLFEKIKPRQEVNEFGINQWVGKTALMNDYLN